MDYVKAINFTGFNYHCIGEEKTKENLRLMQKKTACNTVIIVLGALQDEATSKEIDYRHSVMPKDSDLIDFIGYAKGLGLRVFLKPVIDCRDGSCRADILCEDDSEQWTDSYSRFITHYARIAEKTNCELFFIGCRLLKLETKTGFWRNIIEKVRQNYQGKITYEADIYNEEGVGFWDKLDLVSSGGNYSKIYLGEELHRLVELASRYQKPLLLTECGCMSTKGASTSPNAWDVEGELSLSEQSLFFVNLFEQCRKINELSGIGIWCWNNRRKPEHLAILDKHYYIYGKPACNVIYQMWNF